MGAVMALDVVADPERHRALERTASRRLNVGSGQYPLHYWTNCDSDPSALADLYVRVPPLPFADGGLDDIFAGHFLEHLDPSEASAFLRECFRCLAPGGRLGVVVPDTREIVRRYLRGDLDQVEFPQGHWRKVADLDEVCAMFFYSTVQDSGHRWSYDLVTLGRALTAVGFVVVNEIDRFSDPRITLGAWYQCGLNVIKPK